MASYTDSDYSARNILAGHLQALINEDTFESRNDLKDLLEEFKEEESDNPLTAQHVKDAISTLSKIEEYNGKNEMSILHMPLEEIKKIYDKLISIQMTPGPK